MPFGGALLATGILGAGASIFSGIMGASAAQKAAAIQKAAADAAAANVSGFANAGAKAISDSTPIANTAVNDAKTQGNALLSTANANNIARNQPSLDAGNQATGDLSALSEAPGFKWDEATDPGYQFRMEQGLKALQNSGAARGSAMGGSAVKANLQYGQDYASNEYQNSFNRFQTDRTNKAAMFGTLIGSGDQAASRDQQSEDFTAGTQSANTMDAGKFVGSNTMAGTLAATNMQLQGAESAGQLQVGGANAEAAGKVGAANAWTGAANGVSGTAQNMLLLHMLSGGGGGGGGTSDQWG